MSHVHNAIHRYGALLKGIKNAVGDSDAEAGVERYGETLTPILNVWERPEWLLPMDIKLGSAQTSQTAVALEYSVVGLLVPASSNLIVVVEAVQGRNFTATDTLLLVRADVTSVAAITGFTELASASFCRDFRVLRIQGTQLTRAHLFRGTSAAPPGSNQDVSVSTGTAEARFQSPPFVMGPGDALFVRTQTVNNGLACAFKWYERIALPGERI